MLPNPVFMGSVSDFMICGKRETVTVLSIHRLMNKDSLDKLVPYSSMSILQILN